MLSGFIESLSTLTLMIGLPALPPNSWHPLGIQPIKDPTPIFAPVNGPSVEMNRPGLQLPGWQLPPALTQQRISPAGYPLTIYTLSNGHRIMVEKRPTDIIGLRTYINNGSVIENSIYNSPLYRNIGLPSGLAHLDEHCHFLSTRNFPIKNSWTDTVDSLAGRFNATTSDEFVQHELLFNREDTDTMLRLHAESVLRPQYNTPDLGQEKTNVLNEAALRSRKPMLRIDSKLSELMFDRPEIQTLGTPQDIMATTPQHLAALHYLLYNPTNMVTVVSGNVDPQAVLRILGPEFGNNPARPYGVGNQAIRLALRPGEVRTAQVADPQLTNSMVVMGMPAPARNQYIDRMAMEFLEEILDGDVTSVLPRMVVTDQRLASELESGYLPQKGTGSYRVNMQVQPGQEQLALNGLRNAIGLLSQGRLRDQVVASTRDRLVRRFREMQGNVYSATEMMGMEAANNTLPYYLNYEQFANLITGDDIQRVARQYLNPSTYAVVFGVPAKAAFNGVSI